MRVYHYPLTVIYLYTFFENNFLWCPVSLNFSVLIITICLCSIYMLLYLPFTIFLYTLIFFLISFPSFFFFFSTFNYHIFLILSLPYIFRQTFFITLCCAFSSVDKKQIVPLIYHETYCIFLAPCGRRSIEHAKEK